MEEADLKRLAEIPDPFAGADVAPRPALDGAHLGAAAPRGRVRATRAAAVMAAFVFELAWLFVVEHRPDLATSSPSSLAAGIAIPLAAAVIAWIAVTRPGALGLGAQASRLAALGAVSVATFAMGTLLASPSQPEGAAFWANVARCIKVSSVLVAPPLALGLWVFRHAFAAAAPWRSALLGMAAGALAAATMSLACADDNALHVLVGHGAMVMVGAIAGASVGRLATRA
jgi:hypothetical protein